MTAAAFDLFMSSTAIIIDCYRYELRRVWDDRLPLLVVCMLNPSTADHRFNDPTVLTLIHFAKLWGYGGLIVVNLYAFRASHPKEMFAAGVAAMGPENEKHLAAAVAYAKSTTGRMLVAWGNDGNERARWFARWAEAQGVGLDCLGTTQSGAPKHPMARGSHRIPRGQQPVAWKEPPYA
jgi:hypothetical protein